MCSMVPGENNWRQHAIDRKGDEDPFLVHGAGHRAPL